jgi:glycosidase
LATYLIQNSIWWIEYANFSGVRMDTYSYPDKDFMSEWTCAVMDEYPNFNIVGEEWSLNPAIVAHWQRGKQNPNGYTSCLPSLMDFPLQSALVTGLNNQESHFDGMVHIYESLANDFMYADPMNLVVFPDNHDMDRFYTQIKEDFGLFKLGIAQLLTTRGIPQIYYGKEILMTNDVPHDHGIIRTDFPGGWEGDKVNAFTGEGLTTEQKEAQEFMCQLLNWRKDNEAVHQGNMKHYVPKDGVYVYFRYTDDKKVMVALNKNKESVEIDLGRFSEVLPAKAIGKDIFNQEKKQLEGKLTLPAYAPLILEIEAEDI